MHIPGCPVRMLVLLHLLLLSNQRMEVMAKADGSRGHPQGDVAAASCEIPPAWMGSSSCMAGCLVFKQAFFPLLFLCSPVL